MSVLENLPISPVTQNKSVKYIDSFSADDIIKLYDEQEGLDVSRYFQTAKTVHLLECTDTGYRFYYPFETIGDAEFYKDLQNKAAASGLEYDRDLADDHKFGIEQIKENEKLLEIGCGSGKFLEKISGKTKNLFGLELNPLAVENATKKGFDVKNELVQSYAEKHSESFDIVCAFQVLEHVADVKDFLEACIKLLKPNGRLLFSVPNNEPFFQRFSKYEVLNLPPHHMGLWNKTAFEKLCEIYDLQLNKVEFTGLSSLLIDAYVRARMLSKIKTLPSKLSSSEKAKIYMYAPFALVLSSLDYLRGIKNYGHISVIIEKK